MSKAALAYFRQLCCLGLGGDAVMPSLLKAAHKLIPSETNGFFWADEAGRLVGFSPEYVIPEVIDRLLDDFHGLVDRTLPMDFITTMRRGRPVGNLLPLFDKAFYRGPVYHLIYRPYNLHHAIDGVVRDDCDAMGRGAFVIARSARQPEFNAAEKDLLQLLLPYIAHALHPREETLAGDFTDSGDCGLVILDRWGKVAYWSARARVLLYLAAPPSALAQVATGASVVHRVYGNLVRIFEGRDTTPPVFIQRNASGRFIYRAQWLDADKPGTSAQVGVTVQHQEPRSLVMLRSMHEGGLSPRQTEVGLLLAKACSFDSIATHLHISRTTAKDYVQRIYRKLDVHSREEFLQKLVSPPAPADPSG